jgi:hypothetical protein
MNAVAIDALPSSFNRFGARAIGEFLFGPGSTNATNEPGQNRHFGDGNFSSCESSARPDGRSVAMKANRAGAPTQNAFTLTNGTILTVISGSQDVLTPAVDQPVLYTYLTGLPSTGATLYRPVVADDAVHSMFVSNPTGMLDAFENGVIH